MNELEVLMKLRTMISDRNKWCQQQMETAQGASCLAGWISRIAGSFYENPATEALAKFAPKINPMTNPSPVHMVTYANDYSDYPTVLEWVDITIDYLRKNSVDEKAKRGVAELKETALKEKAVLEAV